MSFFLHDSHESVDSFDPRGRSESARHSAPLPSKAGHHILWEKLCVPLANKSLIDRPRLDEMLERSLSQFGATLISGRAGTGKSALAGSFANARRNAAWYSLESSDLDWKTFSRHFSACVLKSLSSEELLKVDLAYSDDSSLPGVSRYLAALFSKVEWLHSNKELLIVLDDLHKIFDAEWFGDFFNLLLYSLPSETQLLLLCRSKPPKPLWRLRSKQMLNVIDEKLLAFNVRETEQLFRASGLTKKSAHEAYAGSFGRISKLIEIAAKSSKSNLKT